MTQKFIVNGVSYDSPADMPPDVRRQYEHAMEIVKNVREETGDDGSSKATVKSSPAGVSIKVEKSEVIYNVDGKTFTDVRSPSPGGRGGQGVRTGSVKTDPGDDVNVMQVRVDFQQRRGMGTPLLWLLLGAAVVFVLISLL